MKNERKKKKTEQQTTKWSMWSAWGAKMNEIPLACIWGEIIELVFKVTTYTNQTEHNRLNVWIFSIQIKIILKCLLNKIMQNTSNTGNMVGSRSHFERSVCVWMWMARSRCFSLFSCSYFPCHHSSISVCVFLLIVSSSSSSSFFSLSVFYFYFYSVSVSFWLFGTLHCSRRLMLPYQSNM